ncbi:hypothetical protein L6452_34207, partial [Arctium lappa]
EWREGGIRDETNIDIKPHLVDICLVQGDLDLAFFRFRSTRLEPCLRLSKICTNLQSLSKSPHSSVLISRGETIDTL